MAIFLDQGPIFGPQPEDQPNEDMTQLITKDQSSGPTRTKHGRAPATRVTRDSNIESMSHSGQGSHA